MNTERNDTVWLGKMKGFCQELERFLCVSGCGWIHVPPNHFGFYDNLCEMSAECSYVSDINIIDNQANFERIFEIQSMARKILVCMGTHPDACVFRGNTPFFQKALFIALSLAVEHQDACKDFQNFQKVGIYLPEAATTCS
jgi:hypothetical protein